MRARFSSKAFFSIHHLISRNTAVLRALPLSVTTHIFLHVEGAESVEQSTDRRQRRVEPLVALRGPDAGAAPVQPLGSDGGAGADLAVAEVEVLRALAGLTAPLPA